MEFAQKIHDFMRRNEKTIIGFLRIFVRISLVGGVFICAYVGYSFGGYFGALVSTFLGFVFLAAIFFP